MTTTLRTSASQLLLALALVGVGTAAAHAQSTAGSTAAGSTAAGSTAAGSTAAGSTTSGPADAAATAGALSADGASLDASSPVGASADVTATVGADTYGSEPATDEAATDEPATDEGATDDFRNAWVAIGARAGVYVPGLVNRMDPHAHGAIDVTLLFPFLERRLGLTLAAGYAPPGAGVALDDPRLGASGAPWTASMTTEQLLVDAGLVFRILPPGSLFVPYVGVGARLFFLHTSVSGVGAGEAFGQNDEVSLQGGGVGWLGGELRLGPGALLLEVSVGGSELPHTITGVTSTTALSTQLGYRLFL